MECIKNSWFRKISKRAPFDDALLNGLFHVETLLEAIHTSAAVHQLLLAGKEGMALGANFNLQFRLGGTGFERLAAHATDDRLAILGMDLFLHDFHLFCACSDALKCAR